MLDMIPVFLNLLTLVLWWFILENTLYVLEKIVYSADFWMECSLLSPFVCVVLGQCFLVDFLSEWSIHWWKWASEVPYYYWLLSISPFRSVTICVNLGPLILGAYIFAVMYICHCCLVAKLCLTLLRPHGPTRLLHPQDSPGKNTGMGCHFLLQGIFLTQDWTQVSYTAGNYLPCYDNLAW